MWGEIMSNTQDFDYTITNDEWRTLCEKQKKLYAEAQLQLLRDLPSLSVRLFTFPFARQPYIDLGYKPIHTMIYLYHITEKTAILKH